MNRLVQLLDERLADVRLERVRANLATAIRNLQDVVRPIDIKTGAWSPTLMLGNTALADANYIARQGKYLVVNGFALVLAKIKSKSGAAVSAANVKITGLPFAASDALNHWPTWISQASPFVYGLLTASEPAIYLNNARNETNTSWTFTAQVHVNVGVVYEVKT